nr:proline-rich receptor-like protein kinase PERK1 [Aegilops tauschii subsp. strangulata]
MPHPAAFFFVVDAPHSTAFPVAGAPHPTAFPGASAPIPTAFPTAGVPLPALSRRIQAFAGPCYSPLPNPRSVSPSSSSHSALPPLGSTSSHLTCHSLTTSSRPPAPTLNAMPPTAGARAQRPVFTPRFHILPAQSGSTIMPATCYIPNSDLASPASDLATLAASPLLISPQFAIIRREPPACH